MAFTVALVASGTNAGVATVPCSNVRTPARASPSRASIWNAFRGTRGRLSPPGAAVTGLVLRGGALDRLRLAVAVRRLDLDTARLALLRLRDPHLEHAVREV